MNKDFNDLKKFVFPIIRNHIPNKFVCGPPLRGSIDYIATARRTFLVEDHQLFCYECHEWFTSENEQKGHTDEICALYVVINS